jgi:hypothetical protein
MGYTGKISVQQAGAIVAARKRQLIRIRRRRAKVRDLLFKGHNQCTIAKMVGVSDYAISKDVEFILKEWYDNEKTKTQYLFKLFIKRYEAAAQQALDAFEKSKKNEESITTSWVRRPCGKCSGTGKGAVRLMLDDMKRKELPCKTCQGTGEILVEDSVKRVKGQAGDSTLLRMYLDSTREAARISGLYAHVKEREKERFRKKRGNKPTEPAIGTNITVYTNVDWDKVPNEALLKVKYACARAIESSKSTLDVPSAAVNQEGE